MRNKKILIADDESNLQSLLSLCLTTDGYEVSLSSDGQQTMDALARERFDLLLLDLSMPVMDGLSVLRAMRELPTITAAKAPPVIVMTAHGSVRSAVLAIRLGAADFLEKPFSPDDLRLSIAAVLDEAPRIVARPGAGYWQVLAAVPDALRAGDLNEAESLLMAAGTITDSDPCFLNLAGAVHEAHGRPASARRFYERALELEAGYQPARINLDRLNEIERVARKSRPAQAGEVQVKT
jgi:two-component system, OmpR family, alkaline phosphatase synthesis response regulator PhoP